MPFKGLCCDRWIESRKSQKEGQEKQGREKSYMRPFIKARQFNGV
jgi:hypothetical protein